MIEFSISEPASAKVKDILLQYGYQDPVATLYEWADPERLFDDLRDATLGGTKTIEDLGAMGRKRFEEVGNQLKSSLMVGARERGDFQPEHLHEIGGITFLIGPGLAEILRGYCLTFEGDRFLLRGSDNVVDSLLSIAKKG